MATINKTPSNTWKALIRKRGWPTTIKTFRTKRDAQDWARRTEDEMVRGVYIDRADASQLLLKTAMDRYLREVSSTKKPSTHAAEQHKAKAIKAELGGYSLAALNANLIASYRDQRLADGKSANTVRLELSLLSHLFTIAIKETKITNLRFHDLRHEAVSRLVEAGLGDQEVAAISGHKSMQMLKRYTHLRAEDLVERLDQLMV